mmetsp:Transcript_18917/g.63917  ORF Transcript_18917/g.63917 Transcript_18917/m.63917 type:complete len:204 (-) Transcript_18917:162-773(-)
MTFSISSRRVFRCAMADSLSSGSSCSALIVDASERETQPPSPVGSSTRRFASAGSRDRPPCLTLIVAASFAVERGTAARGEPLTDIMHSPSRMRRLAPGVADTPWRATDGVAAVRLSDLLATTLCGALVANLRAAASLRATSMEPPNSPLKCATGTSRTLRGILSNSTWNAFKNSCRMSPMQRFSFFTRRSLSDCSSDSTVSK